MNEDDTTTIGLRDRFRVENALEAAAAFLHETQLNEMETTP